MKSLLEYLIKESDETLNQFSLVLYISKNKEICKNFVRDVRKDFFNNDLITSKESLSNLTQNKIKAIKQILDKNSKKYFNVSYNGLEKKCKGLSDSLFETICSHIINNVIEKDSENDWPAMYNKEI